MLGCYQVRKSSFCPLTSVSHRPLWIIPERDPRHLYNTLLVLWRGGSRQYTMTMDGGVPGYSYVDGGWYWVDSEGGGVERFQGSFCSLFCCHHLTYGRHYRRSNMHCFSNIPDFVARLFTTFPVLHRIAGMEPTSFSPSPLIPSLNSIRHKVSSGAKCFLPVPHLAWCTSILEREEAGEVPYGDDTLDSGVRDQCGVEGWNSEGYDTGEESAYGLMQWP